MSIAITYAAVAYCITQMTPLQPQDRDAAGNVIDTAKWKLKTTKNC